MVLNFKQIPYTTSWIEYPDLAPKLSFLSIPPNDRSAADYKTDYAIPAITLPDGTHMMDSWPIAHKLEDLCPSPSLHLDDPIVARVRDQIAHIMKPLTGFVIPKVPKRVLNERSAVYFNETRKERFGMSLVEVEEKLATEEMWEEARGPVMEAAGWLRQKGGPYFLGETGKSKACGFERYVC
jgi:glutathione S-transferase